MLINRLKTGLWYLLPHHAISRVTFRLTRVRSRLAVPVINWFVNKYNVDLKDAEITDTRNFESFNAFFTRALKATARPIDLDPNSVISPVDGTVSALGEIMVDSIFQAKGRTYSLKELVASELSSKNYLNGSYATIYLSPRDYHRIHMPIDGTLIHMTYVPGRLFSVSQEKVATIPRLFARNERVVAHFNTSVGPMAVILVGALNVAAIETVWAGLITPPSGRHICEMAYPATGETAYHISRGEELGRFNMGSTVILLFGKDAIRWSPALSAESALRMGQQLGQRQTG